MNTKILCLQAALLARKMHNPLTDRLSTTIKRAIECCEGKRTPDSVSQHELAGRCPARKEVQ